MTTRRRRAAEPQVTPEGHRLVTTRFGRFYRDEKEGVWREYETQEQLFQKMYGKRPRGSLRANNSWNPLD